MIAKQMLDEVKVAGIPGDGFGAPNYIRFSFATSDARIQEGISRVAKWIANQSSTKGITNNGKNSSFAGTAFIDHPGRCF